MPKLHEILAVKPGITGKVQTLKTDLIGLFTGKRHHFTKEVVTFKPAEEGKGEENEKNIPLQTTVGQELVWFGREFAKLWDICHTINVTNQATKADVILNDAEELVKNIPATMLLEGEKLIAQLKELVSHIPTLDPTKNFQLDKAEGTGVYKAQPQIRHRTAKVPYPLVLSPATDKHPANVVEKVRDEVIGDVTSLEWSGMLTPSQKSDMLSRCENVIAAIKSAQARANNIDVSGEKNGEKIVKYILG